MQTNPEQRYRFIRDDDGHWYLVPAERYDEASKHFEAVYAYWNAGDDARGEPPDDPDWIQQLGCGVQRYSFTNPEPCK